MMIARSRPCPALLSRLSLTVSLGLLGCGGAATPDADAADASLDANAANPATPTQGDPTFVVPSAGLPTEVTLGASNNNLDVARHEGRTFLAFRSSGNHFASDGTVLWVVSSADEAVWRYEGHFAQGTDLREPRLFVWKGQLWLYYAVLGKDPADFEPQGSKAARWLGPGSWDGPKDVLSKDFIPWRVRLLPDGRPVMIGYQGGANVYRSTGGGLRIQLLTTNDGWTWTPLVTQGKGLDGKGKGVSEGVVLEGGGSEADFALLPDGGLLLVVRNEAGDSDGYGAKVCRAEAADWSAYTCKADPRKYDSPLLIQHGEATWLIGRRSLKNDGKFDLGQVHRSKDDRYIKYQTQWWSGAKRCSLWRVDAKALRVDFALDLPSAGDTCFASALPIAGAPHGYRVWNYTSPLDKPDISWLVGQLGQTSIYRVDLTLPSK